MPEEGIHSLRVEQQGRALVSRKQLFWSINRGNWI